MALNYLDADDLAGAVDSEWLLAAADDNRDDIADADILTQALEDAEAEIDAYLSARYATPLSGDLPGIIRQAGVSLAAEALASRKPGLILGEGMEARVRQARSLLASIARGELALAGGSSRKRTDSTTRGVDAPLRDGGLDAF
jgi:phage gp36-like protein